MMPNMNNKMLKKAMKRMGMKQQEIDADVVIIKCKEKDIVIENADVSKITMQGQETFQVIGNAKEKSKEEKEVEINEEDIKTVMEQADCTKEEAIKAIKENNNDLAQAIIELKE